MREMGIEKFHLSITPITIKFQEETIWINAHNEYWYLFDVNQTADPFSVRANNNIITQDEFVVDGVPFITYEFTGDIKIENTGAQSDQSFLFYRVIPEIA